MINIGIRDSTKKSFFKEALLDLCNCSGDVLILAFGYFETDFTKYSFSNFLNKLANNIVSSGTSKIYIVGGSFSESFKNLSKKDIIILSNSEKLKIIEILDNLSNILTTLIKSISPFPITIIPLYKEHFHGKIAIKAHSYSTTISILLGSSNFTNPSIITGDFLHYYSTETDIFLKNIDSSDTNQIRFNPSNFNDFLKSIQPYIEL